MEKKNTIIFDLDGTLLNTLEDLRDGVNVTMRQFGWDTYSLEEIRSFVGNGIGRLMEQAVPDGATNPKFEEAFAWFKEYYTGHCQIKTRPYEGVLPMLDTLKSRGFKMAIVSNKNDAAVARLNEIYFQGLISVAVGEQKGLARKPAPDEVFAALEKLGSECHEAVYVGDSEVDYATAKNAGLACVLVSWGFRDREMLEGLTGAVVVDCCEELLQLLC